MSCFASTHFCHCGVNHQLQHHHKLKTCHILSTTWAVSIIHYWYGTCPIRPVSLWDTLALSRECVSVQFSVCEWLSFLNYHLSKSVSDCSLDACDISFARWNSAMAVGVWNVGCVKVSRCWGGFVMLSDVMVDRLNVLNRVLFWWEIV